MNIYNWVNCDQNMFVGVPLLSVSSSASSPCVRYLGEDAGKESLPGEDPRGSSGARVDLPDIDMANNLNKNLTTHLPKYSLTLLMTNKSIIFRKFKKGCLWYHGDNKNENRREAHRPLEAHSLYRSNSGRHQTQEITDTKTPLKMALTLKKFSRLNNKNMYSLQVPAVLFADDSRWTTMIRHTEFKDTYILHCTLCFYHTNNSIERK